MLAPLVRAGTAAMLSEPPERTKRILQARATAARPDPDQVEHHLSTKSLRKNAGFEILERLATRAAQQPGVPCSLTHSALLVEPAYACPSAWSACWLQTAVGTADTPRLPCS